VADIYADAAQRRWPGYDNAGPNVMPVFVRRQNPLVVSDLGPNGDHGYLHDNLAEALGLPLRSSRKELHAAAVERGHDVIEVRNMADLGGEQTQYLVLRPENVRSAIGRAPDAPNAGQRGGNGAALAALATLPPGAITLRELLRDHYGTA